MEVSDHGAEDVVVGGVQVIEDGAGKGVLAVEGVQVGGEGAGLLGVIDRIDPGVGADRDRDVRAGRGANTSGPTS